jgi:tetratricopeptide (TPR) repeat protein
VLATQAGTGSDRVAGLRLRVALLDRLRRDTDALVALNELATLDPDPLVAFRLLQRYRELGRWDDVLRVTAAIDPGQASFEMGWFRLEALGALGRPDELLSEADTLIGRLRARSTPHTDLVSRVTPTIAPSASPASTFESMPPYLAERFFPIVFVLLDSGRREPAERLVAALATASPDADNVKRLHVMLFGSPDDRIAFLQATAGASVASNDPEKIRTDAYQRLLAKDFGTAHDLYRRLLELDPAASSFDSGDWFNYGLAAIETAAWAEAETAMTHALESGASKPRAYAHRARARIMLGRIAEGMADAEAALAIDPKLKQACFAMYLAYEKLGVHEKAKEWLARSNAP